jgi:hypothetical protein
MMHGILKASAEENHALRGEVETFKAMIAKMKAMMAAQLPRRETSPLQRRKRSCSLLMTTRRRRRH